jgi:hypothetical protein
LTKVVNPYTLTVAVGIKPTNAMYFVHDHEEFLELLQAMAVCSARFVKANPTLATSAVMAAANKI